MGLRYSNRVNRKNSGQAIIEIAIFGAILIFLIGTILRSHLSSSYSSTHQIRAMKLALQQSYINSMGINVPANSSHNSASVLFIEDRLSPDINKFSTVDRTPFVASGGGTMSNRLMYPIDAGEVQDNLSIMDVFINGQHFPLTVASYVFRTIYQDTEVCPLDWIVTQKCPNGQACPLGPTGGQCSDGSICAQHGPEQYRCLRQKNEWNTAATPKHPYFYSLAVNGTEQYDSLATYAKYDLLRNDAWGPNPADDNVVGCPGTNALCNEFAWQWQRIPAINSTFTNASAFKGVNFTFGTDDGPLYPALDAIGSLREQSIYYISHDPNLKLKLSNPGLGPWELNTPPFGGLPPGNGGYVLLLGGFSVISGITELEDYIRNTTNSTYSLPNSNGVKDYLGFTRCQNNACSSGTEPITGVAVLDSQAGDLDLSWDPKTSPGSQPGLMQQMSIHSWVHSKDNVHQGTYLQIKEGKLYNPETQQVVRSISSKDHVDLITRMIQLSNNTQRFCKLVGGSYIRRPTIEGGVVNPVEACGNCNGSNIAKTCFDTEGRILYVRTLLGDTTVRKWFTDVTKGL